MGRDDISNSITIGPVETGELRAIAEMRVAAFAHNDSYITELGVDATHRYLEWMHGLSDDFFFLCAYDEDQLVGYGIGAVPMYPNKKEFVRENSLFLMIKALKRPGLLFKPDFIRSGMSILLKVIRRKATATVSSQKEQIDGDQDELAFRLLDTAVDPRFQKRGVGTKLLLAREELAMTKGYAKTACTIDSRNQASISLHERYGYNITSSTNGIVRMEKLLNRQGGTSANDEELTESA